jgi:hypothetical protein
MGRECGPIGPLLDEDQPKRVLAIDMNGVREAPLLFA